MEKGPITFRVGDQQQTLQTGDLLYVPSNVMHGGRSGPGGAALLDVFSPIREDLLK